MTKAQQERARFDLWMSKAPKWARYEFGRILVQAANRGPRRPRAILITSESSKGAK